MNADEARYLARLDSLLPEALSPRADPSEVGCVQYGGVLVWLTVPDVPDGESPVISNQLQVLYSEGSLGAYWGCSHLWDDYVEGAPGYLHLRSSDLEPETAADKAGEWLAEQLRRPLVRHEWDKRGRLIAQRWLLTDTETVIGSRGPLLRFPKRPPDRVVVLA